MQIKDMPVGTRFYENASCKIRFCVAIPNQMRSKTRELVSMDVPVNLRRQGMAKELMINICDEADECSMLVIVFPEPFGSGEKMTEEQLIEWYTKFGFQVIQAAPKTIMARMPHSTPGVFKPNYVGQITDRKMK
jgi:N-acetylglutamate synthase-like GNAT family acetyltransferase